MDYGKKLPASNGKTGVIGFCWGGGRSFAYATAQPGLMPRSCTTAMRRARPGDRGHLAAQLANLKAPVLGSTPGTTPVSGRRSRS